MYIYRVAATGGASLYERQAAAVPDMFNTTEKMKTRKVRTYEQFLIFFLNSNNQ